MRTGTADAQGVVEFFRRCEAEDQLERLRCLLLETAASFGLRFIACSGQHGAGPNCIRLHNYPDEWRRRMRQRGYFRIDPVLERAGTAQSGFSWDDPGFLHGLSERQRRMLSEARAYGLAHGYTVPLAIAAGARASVSVVSETGDIDEGVRDLVGLLGAIAYRRALLLKSKANAQAPPQPLTHRQRQCLELKAHGMTDAVIADALGISPVTVARHLGESIGRLHAASRENAVYRAIVGGQIA
jgi:DNA-binding CsgD family transcriptional regulator